MAQKVSNNVFVLNYRPLCEEIENIRNGKTHLVIANVYTFYDC